MANMTKYLDKKHRSFIISNIKNKSIEFHQLNIVVNNVTIKS